MNAPTFRTAHDICDASSLDALGWGFSLKGYRVMRILIAFLAFALAVAVAVVGFAWLVGVPKAGLLSEAHCRWSLACTSSSFMPSGRR